MNSQPPSASSNNRFDLQKFVLFMKMTILPSINLNNSSLKLVRLHISFVKIDSCLYLLHTVFNGF